MNRIRLRCAYKRLRGPLRRDPDDERGIALFCVICFMSRHVRSGVANVDTYELGAGRIYAF